MDIMVWKGDRYISAVELWLAVQHQTWTYFTQNLFWRKAGRKLNIFNERVSEIFQYVSPQIVSSEDWMKMHITYTAARI